MKRLAGFSALGAALFFGLDSLHVRAGIWRPASGGGVPWWFAGVYFAGIFATGLALGVFERRHDLRVGRTALAAEIAAFTLVLVAHLTLFPHEVTLAAVTTAILTARLLWWRAPGDVAVVLVVVVTDLVFESALRGAGTFAYSHARFAPLPLWLCPMWGALALSMRRFFRAARSYQRLVRS